MNIKKQLNKIRDYVEELEEEKYLLHNKVEEYKIALLDKAVDDIEQLPTTNYFTHENLKSQYNFVKAQMEKLAKENARLREALRWHPVSEKPKKDIKCLTPESENVILQIDKGYYPVTAYCSLVSGIWRELKNHEEISVNKRSRWCYIPEDKDGE